MLRELSWSHNLQIMSCTTDEERKFYLSLSVKNRYTFRELKRQMDSSLSPALIADYKLHLPDKRVLENKLRELAELAENTDDMAE